jgi:hypothetical protein
VLEDLKIKDNEKVISYISDFQTCFKKSPYPIYQILKLWSSNGYIG